MARKKKENIEYTIDLENNSEKENYYFIPVAEQECVINFMRNEDFAIISTSDSTMKTKLDKLCEESPEYYSLIEENSYYKTYRLTDKSLISFRKKKKEMSDEMKNAASERFKELHKEGRIGRKKKTDEIVDD